MTERNLSDQLRGKELHFRLRSNDLLESGKLSLTAVGAGINGDLSLGGYVFEEKEFTEYAPPTILGKIIDKLTGSNAVSKDDPSVFVIVEEKNGSISPDDVRYAEWLGRKKGEKPRILMVPELEREQAAESAQPHRLLGEEEARRLRSFWERQWRRVKALPAPITHDAALAAVPRTLIPMAFCIGLAYLKRNEVPLERAVGYIGMAFGFAVGFALFNQTVLNFITFWSEFTKDVFEPYIEALEQWVAVQGEALRLRIREGSRVRRPLLKLCVSFAKKCIYVLSFISARGDVLIAGPLLGIGCVYIVRLILGPVGETVSVLTLKGFLLVLGNVVLGSLASGPYPQVIAHLRSVGKITNRTSMYLGILDTIRMELGRVADFGMQTLYNVIQGTLAVVFWFLLFFVDRCYRKPCVRRLKDKRDAELLRAGFKQFRDSRAKNPVAA
ncbi:MAG: hypothetical protein WCU88_00015 [Elusimicrobiota bacterium]|jgi:hypothetical protein